MHVGEVLDRRFRIERLLGSGTAAQVYRAVDLTDGATVAMKVMRATSGELVERFAREVRILQHLTHPALGRYVASGTTQQGHPFVAMEWLPGEDLRIRLQRGALGLRDAVGVCLRGAEGLAVAHAAGIVHRDLKPSNLFLVNGEPGATKVIDFGMASGPGDGLDTESGLMLGTPAYMAPEQIRSARGVPPAADVFSLGCVLYECLTGRRAFGGGTVPEILDRVTFDYLPKPSTFAPHVPRELDEIVSRMTHKDPEKRLRDGAEVVSTLGSVRLSPAPPPPKPQITGDEQRVVCILVARARAGDPPLAERRDCLEIARSSLGEVIARGDGSLAIVFRAADPIDLAARAARCGLALVEALAETMVVVTMGRETLAPGGPGHETLDLADTRLASAFAHAQTLEGRVRTDELSAGLLEVHFDLARDAQGAFVRGEREANHAVRRILGKATPCVGRDRELKMLADLFDECLSERVARAVLVTGEAGIGKSRLRYEFLRHASARGAHWLGRGDAIRAGSPLGVLADVLRQVAGARDGDAEQITVARLCERVSQSVADSGKAARISEFLAEILRAPSPLDPGRSPSSAGGASERLRAARKNPQLMGDQMQQAWLEFVAAECERQPVVLVLEDLHWGDVLTIRFVDLALRNLADRPFFVLALARPTIHDLFPRLWSGRDTQEIKLHELSPKASAQLVRDALGSNVSTSVLERMVHRAAGNAFYLEECVRAAADGDAEFPATVVAMLQARLERLEPEARQVLRAASVFGQTFWVKGTQALLGGDRRALLRSWLDLLEDREWVVKRATGKFPEHDEYMFRHSFLREGAYAMLTDDDRRVGHCLAGAWLESAGEQDPAVLAEHFDRGGETAKAASCYARAAVDSLRRSDLEGTIARAERGLGAATSEETRAELHWAEAQALWWQGNLQDVARHALASVRGLPPDSAERWDAIGMIVGSLAQLGRCDDARPWVDALLPVPLGAVTTMGAVSSARLAAMCAACIALLMAGRRDDAERLLDAVEASYDVCADADAILAAHLHRARGARALYVTGDLGALLDEVLASARSFEELGDARNGCSARANAGLAYIMLGAYPLAEELLRDALAVAQRIGIDRMGAITEHNLGIAIARQGRTAEGIAHELHAIEELRARSDQRVEGGAWSYVAEMRLRAGDTPGAEVAVRRALELLADFPPIRALAFATLGRVHLEKGESASALDAARAACAILAELTALPGGEDSVRLIYARALDAAGRKTEALEAIQEAYARLRMRAERIADPKWRESFLTKVPENVEIRSLAEEWTRAQSAGVPAGIASVSSR